MSDDTMWRVGLALMYAATRLPEGSVERRILETIARALDPAHQAQRTHARRRIRTRTGQQEATQ